MIKTDLTIRKRFILTAIVTICLAIYYVIIPPRSFVPDITIRVPQGVGSFATAKLAKEKGLVRSATMLHIAFVLIGGENKVQAGDYLFAKPLSVFKLAHVFVDGNYGFVPRRITLPEGLTVIEMADELEENLIDFSKDDFLTLASLKEGYLFPDTYLFMPTATSGEVVKVLEDTFEKRIEGLSQEIAAFNRPLKDIITMASIVEEEGSDLESRRIIAGILWKRLDRGIPLQVDAAFKYILGKTSAELTVDDLKTDSPYNTYRYRGLPPTPIANPGVESITATVTPIDTPYLYFLTGDDGKMYYAKTLEEHNLNKAKYLKKDK